MELSIYAVLMSPLILLMLLIPERAKGRALSCEDKTRPKRFYFKREGVFKSLTAIAASVA